VKMKATLLCDGNELIDWDGAEKQGGVALNRWTEGKIFIPSRSPEKARNSINGEPSGWLNGRLVNSKTNRVGSIRYLCRYGEANKKEGGRG